MLFVISPSKDLDYKSIYPTSSNDEPRLWIQSQEIIAVLRKKSSKQLQSLMDISQKIADENLMRNKAFTVDFKADNSRPALYAFSGDVYRGLEAYTMTPSEVAYCQSHVRILSGLYGLLRPLDLMQAYRLEMGTSMSIAKKKNLYQFWDDTITNLVNDDIKQLRSNNLINLASQEYFQAIQDKNIEAKIINIHFRELRNKKVQFVSYTAKKARGMMVRFAANNNLQDPQDLKKFNIEDYYYDEKLSDEYNWYFLKELIVPKKN